MCDFAYPLTAFKTWDIKLNIANVFQFTITYSPCSQNFVTSNFLLYNTNVGHLDILPM